MLNNYHFYSSRFIFLVLFLFQACINYAQGWERYIEGTNQNGMDIVATADSNYVILLQDYINANDEDIKIIKLDNLGQTVWLRQFDLDTTIRKLPICIAVTQDNGFIIGGQMGETRLFLLKLNSEGEEEWSTNFVVPNFIPEIENLIQTQNGEYVYIGRAYPENAQLTETDILVGRNNAQGEVIWSKMFENTPTENSQDGGYDIIQLANGNLLATGFLGAINEDFVLIQYDPLGNEIWSSIQEDRSLGYFLDELDNGHIIALGTGELLANFMRFSPQGEELQVTNIAEYFSFFQDAARTENNGYVTIGSRPVLNNDRTIVLVRIDSIGAVVWEKQMEIDINRPKYGVGVVAAPDGGFVGIANIHADGGTPYVFKVDSNGEFYSNSIMGRVTMDEAEDCLPDANPIHLQNWIVTATGTDQVFSTTTDENGQYELRTGLGTYVVSVVPPVDYWTACENEVIVEFTAQAQNRIVDFTLQTGIDCPYMTVNISTPFLRRCFPNIYTVQYCNKGTQAASNVAIEITLDPFLHLDSSSITWTTQMDNMFTFEVGEVAIGDCGTFQLFTTTDCDSTVLGQTHCTTASISPDSLCFALNPLWDGSSLTAKAECTGDSVAFRIINESPADMTSLSTYFIMVDEVIMLQGEIQLPSGMDTLIHIPAESRTYRLEVAQVLGHPGHSQPSAVVEGCPDFGNTGLVNWFGQNDENDFIDIDCQENIGSFDPNDKRAFPLGYENQHFIDGDAEIEYMIRFQNTGTDTAFTVRIEDQLSPFLDVRTLKMGVASHPYEWQLKDENELIITFNDILLPDSTVNELASHGFVQFKIKAHQGLEIGTKIDNQAGIFFDFNDAVITNKVFHTIGKDYIQRALISNTEQATKTTNLIKVYPNPFHHQTQFFVDAAPFSELELQLYQTQGQIVKRIKQSGSFITLKKGTLEAGIYFYKIIGNGQFLGSGKVVILP